MEDTFTPQCNELDSHQNLPDDSKLFDLNEQKRKVSDNTEEFKSIRKSARIQSKIAVEQNDSDEAKSSAESKSLMNQTKPNRRKKSKICSNGVQSSLNASSDESGSENMLDESLNIKNSKAGSKRNHIKKEIEKINSVANYFTVDRKNIIRETDDDKSESTKGLEVDSLESSPEVSSKDKKIKTINKAKQRNSLENYFVPKTKQISSEKEVIIVKDTGNSTDKLDKSVDSNSSTILDVEVMEQNDIQILTEDNPVYSPVSNINSSSNLDVEVKEQNDPQITEKSFYSSESPVKHKENAAVSSMNCDASFISEEQTPPQINSKKGKKRKRQKSINADLDVDQAESDSKSSLEQQDNENELTQNDEFVEIDEENISSRTCLAKLPRSQKNILQSDSSLEKIEGSDSISSTVEKQNDSSAQNNCSIVKSKRKKKAKGLENSKADITSLKTTIVKPISDRKLSLRSKGQRNAAVKYSDDDQNSDSIKGNKSSKTGNCSSLAVSEKVPKKESKIGKRNIKGLEKNVKLFPIFSPKTNSTSNKSVKRKESSLEEDDSKILKKSKVKLKDRSEVGEKSKALPCRTEENQSKIANFKDEPVTSKTKLKPDQDDIVVIEGGDCNKSNNVKSVRITGENMSVKQPHAKPQPPPISFPVFSHIDGYDETLLCPPRKTCEFTIKEDKEYEVDVPALGKTMGLINIELLLSEVPNLSKTKKDLSDDMIGSNEILLWTDISEKPRIEAENLDTIKEIKSWLLQWKNKFSTTSNPNSQSEDYFSSDSDDDYMSNCIIISGALGSGKTSTVFYLAKELGFTVLEMNASSCRSGRHVSNQLKEALESYHMENVKISDILSGTTSNKVEEKEISKKEITNKNKKSKDLKSFFGSDAAKSENKKPTQKNKTRANFFIKDKNHDSKPVMKSSEKSVKKMDEVLGKNSYKISGLTIILFDDADVVFEEDEGFWSTVKGFLKISKKPVIFTVSRNLHIVKSILNADIQVFHMEPSTKDTAVKTLKSYCRVYSREKSKANLELLTSHSVCDLRRNLLNAQFWTQLTLQNSMEGPQHCSSSSVVKQVDVNTFIAGALPFSAHLIQKLLFDSSPEVLSYSVCQFLSLGYDILFCNLFSFLYDFKSVLVEELWKDLTVTQCNSASKVFGDSEMWKEACEIFKRKKKALISGSSSEELKNLAVTLDDFSFTDTLKRRSQSSSWFSVPERIRMWTAGLPMWSEQNSSAFDITLDVVSLIRIYLLRRMRNLNCSTLSESTNDIELNLEHPFVNFNSSFTCETEDNLKTISSVLPSSYLLNKSALNLDYLSTIKIMCLDEKNRQLKNDRRRGRFLHYFDSISFYIDKKEF